MTVSEFWDRLLSKLRKLIESVDCNRITLVSNFADIRRRIIMSLYSNGDIVIFIAHIILLIKII